MGLGLRGKSDTSVIFCRIFFRKLPGLAAESNSLLEQSRRHVQVQGFPGGAGFLGAIQHGDLPDAFGKFLHQVFSAERPVQMYIDQAVFFFWHAVNVLFYGFTDTAHGDDHMPGAGRTVIVKEAIGGSQSLVDLVQLLFHYLRQGQVVGIGGFSGLEENVGILGGAVCPALGGIQGAGPEPGYRFHVQHFFQLGIVPDLDFVQLVGGAEAVEKVQKGDPSLPSCQVCHRRQVHNLLDAALGEYGRAGLSAGVDVRVIPEDGQGVGGDGSGSHMDHTWQELPCHAVQGREHEQKPLGSGEGGGQGACQQRSVYGAGGSCLRLHLRNDHGLAKEILPACTGPLMAELRHGRRGGDGEDGCCLAEGVSHMGGGLAAVHGLRVS